MKTSTLLEFRVYKVKAKSHGRLEAFETGKKTQ